jgi:hypothetical protein
MCGCYIHQTVHIQSPAEKGIHVILLSIYVSDAAINDVNLGAI